MKTPQMSATPATPVFSALLARARAIGRALLTLGASALLMLSPSGQAAQLNLANEPLFLQLVVQPNILYLLDDSGSMDWEIIPNNGADADADFCEPNDSSTCRTLDLTPDNNTERLELCVGYNVMAYNPNVVYTPWKGKDDANVTYKNAWLYGGGTDAAPNFAVRNNPYYSAGATFDISNSSNVSVAYYIWTDSNGDGKFNVGECGDKTGATAADYKTFAQLTGGSATLDTSTLSAEQKKNFANWFTYHRKRDFVLKHAVSALVATSKDRVGLATLHNNNSIGTIIKDMTSGTNKDGLLTNVSRINPTGGTPLRENLNDAGKYYEGISQNTLFGFTPNHTGTVNAYTPVLSAANGGACQQNFTILMTDGYYNGAFSGLGNTDADGNSPNAAGNTTWDGGAHTDTYSDTLADIAMHYYERDLHGSLSNTVPVSAGIDDATHQHMVTFTVAFGVNGSITTGPANRTDPFAWPDPFAAGSASGTAQAGSTASTIRLANSASGTNDAYKGMGIRITGGTGAGQSTRITTYDGATKVATVTPDWTTTPDATSAYEMTSQDQHRIDDLRHAAFNGRGQFLSARNAQQLQQALGDAISDITNRTGSAASVAVNSRSLNTETRLYQARFTSGEWSGDLRALSIDAVSGAVGSEVWNARNQINSQNWDTGRAIITRAHNSALGVAGCSAATGTQGGVAFRWANLSTSQQCMLNINPATSTTDTNGSQRLNFVRGDASEENVLFRARGFKLGDIVNSSPIYVGAPPYTADVESVTHSSFRTTYSTRQAMVYVGGNDGMLHGFDANTGIEKIAYVPTAVYPNLNKLTDPNYQHRYFVDGSPTAGDAFGVFTNVSGACASGCWRTVLTTGMGVGAKGVFALDVTDPAGTAISGLAFSETNAARLTLWEFTDSATPNDMGYVMGRPTITRVRTSATTTAWAAIFGNGYNSANERAILYVVNIVNGAIIRKIDLSNGATGTSNGLSAPAVVDYNGDYLADYVYAGDLRGNMWKISLTDNNPNNWGSYYTKSSNPAPLFTATDSNNTVQPITVRPEIGLHPDGEAGYMVYFGTGKYLESGDKAPPGSLPPGNYNYFYGIWDPNAGASIGGSATARVEKTRLRGQTISAVTYGSTEYRTVTDNKLGSAGTAGNTQTWGDSGAGCGSSGGKCMGWYNTFPGSGEMAVSNPVLLGSGTPRILFTTLVPEVSPCSYGGSGWLLEVNPIHGGLFNSDIFGLTSDPTVGANATTIIGRNPGVGIMPEPTILRDQNRDLKIVTGSTGAVQSVYNKASKSKSGRQSWRQLR